MNDETKKRVAELARSLNYTINIGAQNLRLSQNRTIAVVIPYDATNRQHVSDPFFLQQLDRCLDNLSDPDTLAETATIADRLLAVSESLADQYEQAMQLLMGERIGTMT